MYLHDNGQTQRFASQVKALLAGGAIAADHEPAGLIGYWIWGYVPEPWTLYKNTLSREPGTWLGLTRNGSRSSGTFESVEHLLVADPLASSGPRRAIPQLADETTAMTLREALFDTVRHHLIAEYGSSLRSVSLGFEEYYGTPGDETILAAQVAHQYGAEHQTVWVKWQDFALVLPEVIDAMDQPSIDGLNSQPRPPSRPPFSIVLDGLHGADAQLDAGGKRIDAADPRAPLPAGCRSPALSGSASVPLGANRRATLFEHPTGSHAQSPHESHPAVPHGHSTP